MNEEINVKPKMLRPFTKLCMTIGELPASYIESMSYYEQLIWFTKYLQEQVIPAVNSNAAAVEELQGYFLELQEYVNNYFDNLDVQDEINNKLDDMVEQGTLQEIIADYLNSKALFGFDNVAGMKAATNLIDGSYARTLGYYSKNDGGSATYKIRTITNDDVVDEMFIIELADDTLIAELIKDEFINVKQIGLVEDTNESTNFTNALTHYNKYIFPNGTFILDNIELPSNSYIKVFGKLKTSINFYIFKMTSVTNVTIDGGEYEGQNTSNSQSIFNLGGSSNCTLKNMKISKALNKGIEIGGASTYNLIENVEVSGCTSSTGAGISIGGATTQYNTLSHIKTSGNRIGITLNGCYYNNVDDVYSQNDIYMGLTIDGIVDGAGDGGCYNNVSNIHVSGISQSTYGGIYLGNTSCYNNFTNIEVKDSATAPGIKQTNLNGNGNTFSNIIIKNTIGGMQFSSCQYNTLTNFYIEPASGRGIYVSSADHTIITNGTIKGATSQGILVQSGYCTLSNLKVHNCDTGIQLAFGGTTPTDNNVSNVEFANNTKDFEGASVYKIENCTGYVVSNFKNESKSNSQYIAHGLSATPKSIILTPSVAGHIAYVMDKSATNFQVGLVDTDGNAVTTQETIYWWAHI